MKSILDSDAQVEKTLGDHDPILWISNTFKAQISRTSFENNIILDFKEKKVIIDQVPDQVKHKIYSISCYNNNKIVVKNAKNFKALFTYSDSGGVDSYTKYHHITVEYDVDEDLDEYSFPVINAKIVIKRCKSFRFNRACNFGGELVIGKGVKLISGISEGLKKIEIR